MITFKQYLQEQTDEYLDDPSQIASIIKRDCLPFLREIGDKLPLYRGILSRHSTLTRRKVRKDRIPKDTSKEVHHVLNLAFKQLSGINYRSEAVFVTHNKNVALDYGAIHMIFPIGNFDYAWSPKINDAFEWFAQGDLSNAVLKKQIEYDPENLNKYYDDVFEFIVSGKAKYKFNTGLQDAAAWRQEIMIHCDEYYALPAWGSYDDLASDVLEILKVKMKEE